MGRPTSLEKLRKKQIHGLRESISRIEKELHDPATPGERIPALSRSYSALVHVLLRYEGVPTPMPEPLALRPKRGRGRPYSSTPRKVVRGDNGSLWAIYRRFNRDIAVEVPGSRDMSPTHLSKEWVSSVTLAALDAEVQRLGLGQRAAATLGAPAAVTPDDEQLLSCGLCTRGDLKRLHRHRPDCNYVDLLG